MIHNNLRKLMRLYSRADGSGDWANINDMTDITGYTGINGTDSLLTNRISYGRFTKPAVITNRTFSSIKNVTGTNETFCYAFIGNSSENEPNYAFGSFADDNIKVSTVVSKSYDYIYTTTLVNSNQSPVTIDEIGFFLHCCYAGTGYWHADAQSESRAEFLLAKEKLDEPITLPVGGSLTVTFNLFPDIAIEGS